MGCANIKRRLGCGSLGFGYAKNWAFQLILQ